MTIAPLRPTWKPRPEPLQPAAVVARGDVVTELARDTAARLESGAALTVAHAPGWLVVLGAADDLPWADGVVYLGLDEGLLLPTIEEPSPGAAFLAAALPPAPVRVVLPGQVLVTAAPTRPPDPRRLAEVR